MILEMTDFNEQLTPEKELYYSVSLDADNLETISFLFYLGDDVTLNSIVKYIFEDISMIKLMYLVILIHI